MKSEEDILLLKSIGERIRVLRKKKGISQDKLSIEADVPKNQIGRIERYEINTTVLTLSKIAKVLEVDVKDFFEEL